MSKNCLVTKLKGVVENESLEKLGVLRLQRVYLEDDDANSAYFAISRVNLTEGQSVKLTIVGDGYFKATYDGESIGKEVTINAKANVGDSDTVAYYTSNGNYVIEAESKYLFKAGQMLKAMNVDVADVYYTDITYIAGAGYYGDLSKLKKDKIKGLRLTDSNINRITYKSEDIGSLTLLTKCEISDPQFPEVSMADFGKLVNLTGNNQISCASGSVESFVSAQRAGGRTSFSDSLNLKWLGASGNVTFNGAKISNTQDGVITWTATTITFRGTTINA